MAACSVGDLHGAHCIVAADHFPVATRILHRAFAETDWHSLVRVLDGWGVGIIKCALDKSVNQTCFSHSYNQQELDYDRFRLLRL